MTFKEHITEASSQQEKWVLILKLKFGDSPKFGQVTKGGKYVLKRAEELTPKEKELLDQLTPYAGLSEFKKGYSDGEGNMFFFDALHKLKKIVEYYQSFCNLKQVVPMKDKTKEHFGDIMEKAYAKTEGSSPKEEWVVMLKFTKVGSDYAEPVPSEITYTMKKAKDLTPKEQEKIKTLKPFTGFMRYKKAFSNTDKDGRPFIAFFDTKKKVQWIVWYYKECGNKMTASIPVSDNTHKHFGHII
jgi:hypothetical protein